MTDVTTIVVELLAATGMSALVAGWRDLPFARIFFYSAMIVSSAKTLGVSMIAPISTHLADMLMIAAFGWLSVMTFIICGRGLRRIIAERSQSVPG